MAFYVLRYQHKESLATVIISGHQDISTHNKLLKNYPQHIPWMLVLLDLGLQAKEVWTCMFNLGQKSKMCQLLLFLCILDLDNLGQQIL